LSVVGLAVVCTALAFVVFFELIAEVGPTRSVVITYLNPAVALLLGVAILDEAFTGVTALGFGLILLGSVLATRRDVRRPAAVPAAPEAVPVPSARGSARQAIDSDCDVLSAPVAEP
jgi:drug/metabolite transporter (DMT)-like permease